MEAALRAVLRVVEAGRRCSPGDAALRLLAQACDRAWAAAARGAPHEGGAATPLAADRIPEDLARCLMDAAFAGVPATERARDAAWMAVSAATTLASFAPPAALPAALAPGAVAAAAIGQLERAWAACCAAGGAGALGLEARLWAACQTDTLAELRAKGVRSRLPPGSLARAARPPAALAVLQLLDVSASEPRKQQGDAIFVLGAAFVESCTAGGDGSGGGGDDDSGGSGGDAALRAAWGDGELDAAARQLAASLLDLVQRAAVPGLAPGEARGRGDALQAACRAACAACDCLPRLALRLARAAGLPAALAACVISRTVGAECIEWVVGLQHLLLVAAVDTVQDPQPGAPALEALAACRDPRFVRALLRLAAAPPTCAAASAGGRAAGLGRAHPGAGADDTPKTPSPASGDAATSVLCVLTAGEALAGLPSSVAAAAPASTAAVVVMLRRFAAAGDAPPGALPPQHATCAEAAAALVAFAVAGDEAQGAKWAASLAQLGVPQLLRAASEATQRMGGVQRSAELPAALFALRAMAGGGAPAGQGAAQPGPGPQLWEGQQGGALAEAAGGSSAPAPFSPALDGARDELAALLAAGADAAWLLAVMLHARPAWRAGVAEEPGALALLARLATYWRVCDQFGEPFQAASALRLLADAVAPTGTGPSSAGRRPEPAELRQLATALERDGPEGTVQRLLARIATASSSPAAAAEARAALRALGLAAPPTPSARAGSDGLEPQPDLAPEAARRGDDEAASGLSRLAVAASQGGPQAVRWLLVLVLLMLHLLVGLLQQPPRQQQLLQQDQEQQQQEQQQEQEQQQQQQEQQQQQQRQLQQPLAREQEQQQQPPPPPPQEQQQQPPPLPPQQPPPPTPLPPEQQQQTPEATAASSSARAARPRRACTACGRTRRDGAELRRCAGCGHLTGVRYCSPECCRHDWLHGHKAVCEAARGLGGGGGG
jgi:type II secretory pathway pseudopilin PulG